MKMKYYTTEDLIDITNPSDMKVVEKVARMNKQISEISLMTFGFCPGHNVKLEPYDESNKKYKEYEKAELEAEEFIYDEKPIPSGLKKYLLDTIEERKEWHKYFKTHYRETDQAELTPEFFESLFK